MAAYSCSPSLLCPEGNKPMEIVFIPKRSMTVFPSGRIDVPTTKRVDLAGFLSSVSRVSTTSVKKISLPADHMGGRCLSRS